MTPHPIYQGPRLNPELETNGDYFTKLFSSELCKELDYEHLSGLSTAPRHIFGHAHNFGVTLQMTIGSNKEIIVGNGKRAADVGDLINKEIQKIRRRQKIKLVED